jgi:hypothetical protein
VDDRERRKAGLCSHIERNDRTERQFDQGSATGHVFVGFRVMSEPTNTQLANFACVLISGPGISDIQRDMVKDIFDSNPEIRKVWLGYHADFQKKVNELDLIFEEEDASD